MSKKALNKIELKRAGLKVTPVRILILDILKKSEKPLNAEKILKKIGKDKADFATIYRNLTSFVAKGILKQVELRKKSAYYEISDLHRHRIICNKCERIENFERCNIGFLKDVLRNSRLFDEIKEHSLELFGVCKKCNPTHQRSRNSA